jgi:hypothetical protein
VGGTAVGCTTGAAVGGGGVATGAHALNSMPSESITATTAKPKWLFMIFLLFLCGNG